MMQIVNEQNIAIFDENGWLNILEIDGHKWEFLAESSGWSLKIVGDDDNYLADSAPSKIEQFENSLVLQYDSLCNSQKIITDVFILVRWFWEESLLCCGITVESLPDDVTLDAIVFPDVVLPAGKETLLTLPFDTGGQIRNIAEILNNNPDVNGEYVFKNLNMQVVGWEDAPGHGLMMTSRDKNGWIKQWNFEALADGKLRFGLSHFTPRLDKIDSFTLPYSTGIGTFGDGWYGCAQQYREWAIEQHWADRDESKRSDSYVDKIACWLWNRGRAENVCPPVNELSKRIGKPVALDWYWWHDNPYDMGYPEYFPPREGEDIFQSAIDDLHDHGNYVQVYTNGMSWDMELDSWKQGGQECGIVLEDGKVFNITYNTWTNHRLGHICGSSKTWKDIILDIAAKIKAFKLDGLYLDQIAVLGGRSRCFSENHGHLPGGGDYAIKGFRNILEEIRKEFPGLVLSSESTVEYFWDCLDANITLFSSFERVFTTHSPFYEHMTPVPFVAAVYHGRGVMFGTYAIVDSIPPYDELWPEEGRPDAAKERDWKKVAPEQFAFELARTISFGIQPMVANLKMEHLNDPEFADDIDFLVELCRAYYENRAWLLWGRLMEPCDINCDSCNVSFIRRGIFTQPDDVDTINREFPSIFSSTWKDKQERIKTFLINYTQTEQNVIYRPGKNYVAVGDPKYLLRQEDNSIAGVMPPRSIEIIDMEII